MANSRDKRFWVSKMDLSFIPQRNYWAQESLSTMARCSPNKCIQNVSQAALNRKLQSLWRMLRIPLKMPRHRAKAGLSGIIAFVFFCVAKVRGATLKARNAF